MKSMLMMLVVLAVAVSAQATLVPNGDFELLFVPDSGNALATMISDGGYTKTGLGLGVALSGGTYSHGGETADVFGWVSDVDDAPVVATQTVAHSGINVILINGDGWGQPGGYVISATTLGLANGDLMDLSIWAKANVGTPETNIELELLANGIALSPISPVDPAMTADWQEFTRRYDTSGVIGQNLTIRFGLEQNAEGKAVANTGTQTAFDDVTLTTVVPEPATMALLALGGLGLIRRRRNS